MDEYKKGKGVMGMLMDGLSSVSRILTASIFPPMAEGAEMVMKTIENRLVYIQKRMLRSILSSLTIGFGAILLIFALFFSLVEYLEWSRAAAFFTIGIIVFVAGLLLKLGESRK